jgi:hypothetical protein
VTTSFWPQGDFVARSAGMPAIPRVQLPHPVAGTGRDAMQRVAVAIVDDLLKALRGAQ